MSQKVWRNAEGREFPAYDDGSGWESVHESVSECEMRALGYKLVDTDSVSATQAGSPSGGTPLAEVIREAKREAWDECADKLRSWENEREADELIEANPYGPEPPKEESE